MNTVLHYKCSTYTLFTTLQMLYYTMNGLYNTIDALYYTECPTTL